MGKDSKIMTQALIPHDWPNEILDDTNGDLKKAQAIMWMLVLYGSGNLEDKEYFDEPDLDMLLKVKYREMDKMKQESKNKHNIIGRSVVDNDKVKEMKSKGYTAPQIAERLGVDDVSKIYNCKGWRGTK